MGNPIEQLLQAAKLLYAEQQTDAAISVLREVVRLDPLNRDAHINLAYALCRSGDYLNGGLEFLWLWMPVFGDQSGVLASNKNLSGKTFLLSADAGLGDTIMFSRFAKALRNRNCEVILQVQPQLLRLIQQSNLADRVISTDDNLPAHDLRIPLHNLMATLGTEVESMGETTSGYLTSSIQDRDRFLNQLPIGKQRKVGLCWQGNPSLPDDSKRSVPLEYIMGLTQQGDHLVSLLPGCPVTSSRPLQWYSLQNIAETAALIKCLDLVITVDTMVCHLSGALGIPTILLNRFNGCWRWGDHGNHSDWYKSMTIKRQRRELVWDTSL